MIKKYDDALEVLKVKVIEHQNKIARDTKLQREDSSAWFAQLQTLSYVIALIEDIEKWART